MGRRTGHWAGGTINDQPARYLAVIRYNRDLKRQGYRIAEECKLRRLFGWRWHRHWPEAERESCEQGRAFLAGERDVDTR